MAQKWGGVDDSPPYFINKAGIFGVLFLIFEILIYGLEAFSDNVYYLVANKGLKMKTAVQNYNAILKIKTKNTVVARAGSAAF